MEQPLPHTDAAWERRGLLGRLPTHPALSLDPPLYKGGTIPQALTERETMRRTEGTGRGRLPSTPTRFCSTGQRGPEGQAQWERSPFPGETPPFLGPLAVSQVALHKWERTPF